MKLTTSKVGFFTKANSVGIPETPGVYAWFYPIDLKFLDENSLKQQLIKLRRVHSYDSNIRGLSSLSNKFDFNWDPLTVNVRKMPDYLQFSPTQVDNWISILDMSDDIRQRVRSYAMLGTLFTQPLYVGLTRNLRIRYKEHVEGLGKRSTFHRRFTEYLKELDYNEQVEDLLFVCIPFVKEDIDGISEETDSQLKLVEAVLKLLGKPVFGEK